ADGAGVGDLEARDQVEGRRLARPVGADNPEDLALPEGEAHPVDGGDPAEALGQPLDLEDGPGLAELEGPPLALRAQRRTRAAGQRARPLDVDGPEDVGPGQQ